MSTCVCTCIHVNTLTCTCSYSFAIGFGLYIINETLEGCLAHWTLVTDLRPLNYTHITEAIYNNNNNNNNKLRKT